MGRKKDENIILKPDAFIKIRWDNSLVLLFAGILTNLILLMCPMTLIRKFMFPLLRRDPGLIKYTKLIIEFYVFLLIFLEAITLFCFARPDFHWICIGVAIFGLWDVLGATLRDIIIASSIHKDGDGPYILVQDPIRWLLMMPMSILQVILCFAILFLCFGNHFGPNAITEPVTAFYQSIMTFTTLGYGDITPIHDCYIGKIIIVSELIFLAPQKNLWVKFGHGNPPRV
jgi:hypothetical protein